MSMEAGRLAGDGLGRFGSGTQSSWGQLSTAEDDGTPPGIKTIKLANLTAIVALSLLCWTPVAMAVTALID